MLTVRVKGNDKASREVVIAEPAEVLAPFVNEPQVLLKSAGAAVVKATSRQTLSFADHPPVKAIYPNRHLKK